MVDPDTLLLVGRFGRAHGVRGEVKLIPETDDPERLGSLPTLYVGKAPQEAAAHPHRVASVRFQPTKRGPVAVVRLEAVETREGAETLRGQEAYASEADLPPLADDEVFVHDLIGLPVVTEDGEAVGTLADVMALPAHDVFVVRRPGHPDAMVPAVPAFIASADPDAGRIVVRPIEGLFD